MSDNLDLVFEHWNDFIVEHKPDLETPSEGIDMIANTGSYETMMNRLTESLDDDQTKTVRDVCDHQRHFLMTESGNLLGSSVAAAYAISYFPILTHIYADPMMVKVATTHVTDKPVLTIPRFTMKGTVADSAGVKTTYDLPQPKNLLRAPTEAVALIQNESNNLFTLTTRDPEHYRVNRRFLIVTMLNVTGGAGVVNVPVTLIPDARGQIKGEVDWIDGGVPSVLTFAGSVNYDKGTIQYTLTDPLQVVTSTADIDTVMSPKDVSDGRVKITVEHSGFDVDIDLREDFEIDLSTESIQDWSDIYNIDLIKTMTLAIKQQILLNKDLDLAYFLGRYENEMVVNGSSRILDLDAYKVGAGDFRPANTQDVFKSVIPKIASVCYSIFDRFHAEPQILLTGTDTATILQSLQEYIVGFKHSSEGASGFEAGSIGFAKKLILHSPAIPNDKIYVIYKAGSGELNRTAIADLIYQPLYIIDEITNGVHRTFVRARTAIQVTAPEALGVITIQNYNDLLN